MRVRKLTPVEAERLQGLPDGWTDILYGKPKRVRVSKSGEPERFEVRRVPAADSPRYRALGNAMALPCIKFVLLGIAEVMGSSEASK